MRLRRGDVSAHQLASRATHLSIAAAGKKGGLSDFSTTYETDLRALKTIVGDFADSVKHAWHTVDLLELPRRLGSTNVFCLTAYPMPLSVVQNIDTVLKFFSPYIGAIDVDAGNPLHLSLFSQLPDCAYFDRGTLFRSRWATDEGVYEFGTNPENFFSVSDLSYIDFRRTAPSLPKLNSLSKRGKTSYERMVDVTKPSHFEEVAQKILVLSRDAAQEIEIDFEIRSASEEQMVVPVGKLLGYSLNVNHEKGKHKARLFSDLLSIQDSHWRYLAYQLVDGLKTVELEDIRITSYGVQYSARIQVVGLNGSVHTVQTGWIIRKGESAQLTTAYPAEKSRQLRGPATPPPYVDQRLRGANRWRAIYNAASQAGRDAASICTPTPMKIEGFQVELEGLCGGAYVHLDGRIAFSKWLISENYARRGYPSGVCVYAEIDSQSAERAQAYANAFARVIWLNGIDSGRVSSYLS